MPKNFTKFVRNPNSPEAIEARRNNQPDLTPYEPTEIILDNKADNIVIDRTINQVAQRASGTFLGGNHLSQKIVRSSLLLLRNGKSLITSYFFNSRDYRWIVTKTLVDHKPADTSSPGTPSIPTPRPTYGGTYGGFFSSAPGENWRNQNRSMQDIQDAEARVYRQVPLDPNADRTVEQRNGELADNTPPDA